MGAFVACASSTSWTIWASAVSLPTRVARKVTLPDRLTVAPMTSSPIFFATGRGSPVSIDSSTAEAPSVTTPSTGIFSPGFTMTRSPGTTSSTGIATSLPSRTTCAALARSPARWRIAAEVRPRARASSSRPSRISAMMALDGVQGPAGQEEHRPRHRDDGRDAGEDELPGERPDLLRARQTLPLERILGRDRGRDLEARLLHGALQLLARRHARHVVHRDRLGRLVGDGANHALGAGQRLLERQHARRVVELLHGEGDAGLAAVVARRADGLDQLRDVRLAVVVVDGRLRGGEVDRRAHDAVRARERLLHRGGAGRAAHALDGEDDPRLTHGTCAATRPACGRPWPARPPAGPSACSSRSASGIRRARTV